MQKTIGRFLIILTVLVGAIVAIAAACEGDGARSPERAECEDAGGIWHDHTFTPRDADCHPAAPTPEPTNTPTNTPTEQAEEEPTEAPEPTQPPKATDTPEATWETGPVTEETVREALDDLDNLGLIGSDIDKDNITFLSVIPHWETDGYIVAVEFQPGTVLGDTAFLTVAGKSTLIAMAKLFANPDVDRVQVSAMADLVDALGNESTGRLTTATINRATADEINWQGFADRQLLDNKHIFCFADAFMIRPLIYNALGDTGCLPGPSRSEG